VPGVKKSCSAWAAYCRVSSGSDQQMESLKAQTEYYEKYIREHSEYTFAGIYADEGISGTDIKKRDAFNQLMQDARDGHVDMIITKSLSRFGRNTLDCLNHIRDLKSLGVDVYFEKENIHTMRSEGEMLITLISAVAQNESLTQSENVKWGIHRKYERGNIKSVPCGKFLGYDKDENGNLVINPEQAETVRRIYREFLDGYGTFQIARHLTSEKIPMAYGGKAWCASHIRKVLTNEKIKGDTKFQKTYNADYLTKKRVENNGELPQYYIEGTHPGCFLQELFPESCK
jgi:DNA invertase Pin-like site-specific DNA recombinase